MSQILNIHAYSFSYDNGKGLLCHMPIDVFHIETDKSYIVCKCKADLDKKVAELGGA